MKRACLLLSLVACTGTDTGNPPVIDFGNSGCHGQTYAVDKGTESLTPDARYKGLTCLAFERNVDMVRFTISNYEAGCGADSGWTPRVEKREGGGVDLILEDRDCISANCGACLYDLSFTIDASEIADGEVHLYQRGCSGVRQEKVATLALSASSGVACDYTAAGALVWKGARDGSERDLCTTTCQQGLTCTPLAKDGERCLKNCSVDTDCDALSKCVTNVCQLSTTGLFTP